MQQIKKVLSKCMYCTSTNYGSGCPYSPHHKHVHTDDGTKCIYCGSSALGAGCPYNPFAKIHIRGAEYNFMKKESVYNLLNLLIVKKISEPIVESLAYKLNLIDETGRVVKDAETIEEQSELSPLNIYLFKLKKLVGKEKLELLNNESILKFVTENVKNTKEFNAEHFENELKLKQKIQYFINDYQSIIHEGIQSGFSKEYIENMVAESLIKTVI